MVKVIGVRFRTAGKIYYFDPLNFQVKRGDHVIVETARGVEYGTVVGSPREVEDDKVVQPLKPVLRVATERDDEQEAGNKAKEKEAFKICQEKIRKHGLEMKLIDAEYTFDNNKVLFYFTADGRVDFRELVKDLAGVFKTRIELRQLVKVLVEVNDEKELREYKVEQLKFRRRQHGRGRKNGEGDEKEMKELEKLERQEKKEGKSKLDD